MSSQRGSGQTRKRAQKHKNSFAFKNDLHDKTPQMKKMNSLNVCEVCERCKAQIEWRIKYKKYKPLSQAKTCVKCGNRTVTKAYHVCCKECAKREKVCAKCLKSGDQVNIEPPEKTPEEQQQLKVEMDRLIKSLPERKRRTFLRYMNKGKEIDGENGVEEQADDKKEGATENGVETAKKKTFVPHNRADLLSKIESLKLADDEGDDDFSFGESDDGSDFEGSEFDDDDDEE
ncbi:uncharacterized protein C9orf85 homolog [Sitodiplosis mosellana]|uniref:uncharacterized protein C9orf85 homolog n=1 Tax=Sitodiplosis mosellana TaxID=263140 RepID=UPI002443F2FD|nr:uncharacterized protein C9orf85 homolog [Sitodiplosis mosellana]